MPVTISVTQCSTCTRVFISRKKYSPSWSRPSIVPARAVADRARRVGADLADPLAQLGVDRRRGRLLDQLLVAALDRAVALEQVDHVAVGVGEHLHLDVARVGQVALDVDGRVGEELLALARGALEGLLELVLGLGDAEALAAAAAGRLDRHRVADRVVDHLARVLDGLDRVGRAGHDRHARLVHDLAGARLRAHRVDRARRRADEDDPGLLAGARERGVLGEEAVAGVDRLGARLLRDLEDLVDLQVALAGRARGRAGRPRRRAARAARRDRARSRRPRSRCRAPRACASRGSRSRRGWRPEPSRTSAGGEVIGVRPPLSAAVKAGARGSPGGVHGSPSRRRRRRRCASSAAAASASVRAAERPARPVRGASRGGSRCSSSASARASGRRSGRRSSCWPAGPASPPPTRSAAARSACSTRPMQPRRDRLRPARHRPVRAPALPRARAREPARCRAGGGRAAPPGSAPRRALYTSRDSAEDIEAIRQRLGVERIALYGTSYGTKVALGYALALPGQRRAARARLGGRGRRAGPALPRHVRGRAARAARALPGGCCGFTRDPVGGPEHGWSAARAARAAARAPSWTSAGGAGAAASRARTCSACCSPATSIPPLRAAFPGAVRAALDGDAAPLLRLRRRAFEVDGSRRRRACSARPCTRPRRCEETPFPGRARRPPDPAASARRRPRRPPRPFRTRRSCPSIARRALDSDTARPLRALAAAPLAPDLGAGPLPGRAGAPARGRGRPAHTGRERAAGGGPVPAGAAPRRAGHRPLRARLRLRAAARTGAFGRFMQRRPVPAALPARPARASRRRLPPPRGSARCGRCAACRARAGRTLAAIEAHAARRRLRRAHGSSIFAPEASPTSPAAAGCARGTTGSARRHALVLSGVAFVPGVAAHGADRELPQRRHQRGRLRVGGRAAPHGVLTDARRLLSGRVAGRPVRDRRTRRRPRWRSARG